MKRIKGMLIKAYNCLMRTNWINQNRRLNRRLRAMFIHNICREMKVSFGGDNPDKLFYVIRDPKGEHGLFALYNFVMFHLEIAEQKRAIPIVDAQYYPLEGLIEDDKIGRENAWEYFFDPVSPYTLSEIYHSKNVIMASGIDIDSLGAVYDENVLQKMRKISDRYIHIKQEILSVCEERYQEFHMGSRNILGVICRGTDYTETRPKGHSITPDAWGTINVIREKEMEWGGGRTHLMQFSSPRKTPTFLMI